MRSAAAIMGGGSQRLPDGTSGLLDASQPLAAETSAYSPAGNVWARLTSRRKDVARQLLNAMSFRASGLQ